MKKPIWQVFIICAGALLPIYLGVYTLLEQKKIFFNKISGYSISHPDLNLTASIFVASAYFLTSIILFMLLSDKKITKILMQVLGVFALILFIASAYVNTV